MNIERNDNLWDISKRPHTKTKLAILEKCFDMWLTVWNAQNWASDEWYVIDLFAGRGVYIDNNQKVNGSPLIYLNTITKKIDKLRASKIKFFFVECNSVNFDILNDNIHKFIENNSSINSVVDVKYINDDCNEVIGTITDQMINKSNYPLFVFIDPYGIKIRRSTVEQIVTLKNRKDIMFNYMLEGVRRTRGIAKKEHYGKELKIGEINTIDTLKEFIGDDIDIISLDDLEILKEYVKSILYKMQVVAYDMPYPNRNDILYYLLYASTKRTITDIVKDIYARQKENNEQLSLFGLDFCKNNIISIAPNNKKID